MPLLALDTATATPAIALVGAGGELLRGIVVDGRAQLVVEALDTLLADGDREAIEAVVVGVGPGTFTGLRVGVATARGIAETLGVPLYGCSSMQAVERDTGGRAVLAAGRGESFVQVDDGPVRLLPTAEAGEVTPITAESLARAAAARYHEARRSDEPGDPSAVVPEYGREPDATPPRMDVRIDELRDDDLDALMALEHRCFPTPWTRGMYASELYRLPHDRVLLAARDAGANDRLVGAALAARIGDCWHVMNVLVDPIARRRRIADRLMRELLERSAELGPEEGWTLEVRDDNDAAIRLYESLGFVNRGRRRGYYRDTGQDAIVMWRPATVEATTR